MKRKYISPVCHTYDICTKEGLLQSVSNVGSKDSNPGGKIINDIGGGDIGGTADDEDLSREVNSWDLEW